LPAPKQLIGRARPAPENRGAQQARQRQGYLREVIRDAREGFGISVQELRSTKQSFVNRLIGLQHAAARFQETHRLRLRDFSLPTFGVLKDTEGLNLGISTMSDDNNPFSGATDRTGGRSKIQAPPKKPSGRDRSDEKTIVTDKSGTEKTPPKPRTSTARRSRRAELSPRFRRGAQISGAGAGTVLAHVVAATVFGGAGGFLLYVIGAGVGFGLSLVGLRVLESRRGSTREATSSAPAESKLEDLVSILDRISAPVTYLRESWEGFRASLRGIGQPAKPAIEIVNGMLEAGKAIPLAEIQSKDENHALALRARVERAKGNEAAKKQAIVASLDALERSAGRCAIALETVDILRGAEGRTREEKDALDTVAGELRKLAASFSNGAVDIIIGALRSCNDLTEAGDLPVAKDVLARLEVFAERKGPDGEALVPRLAEKSLEKLYTAAEKLAKEDPDNITSFITEFALPTATKLGGREAAAKLSECTDDAIDKVLIARAERARVSIAETLDEHTRSAMAANKIAEALIEELKKLRGKAVETDAELLTRIIAALAQTYGTLILSEDIAQKTTGVERIQAAIAHTITILGSLSKSLDKELLQNNLLTLAANPEFAANIDFINRVLGASLEAATEVSAKKDLSGKKIHGFVCVQSIFTLARNYAEHPDICDLGLLRWNKHYGRKLRGNPVDQEAMQRTIANGLINPAYRGTETLVKAKAVLGILSKNFLKETSSLGRENLTTALALIISITCTSETARNEFLNQVDVDVMTNKGLRPALIEAVNRSWLPDAQKTELTEKLEKIGRRTPTPPETLKTKAGLPSDPADIPSGSLLSLKETPAYAGPAVRAEEESRAPDSDSTPTIRGEVDAKVAAGEDTVRTAAPKARDAAGVAEAGKPPREERPEDATLVSRVPDSPTPAAAKAEEAPRSEIPAAVVELADKIKKPTALVTAALEAGLSKDDIELFVGMNMLEDTVGYKPAEDEGGRPDATTDNPLAKRTALIRRLDEARQELETVSTDISKASKSAGSLSARAKDLMGVGLKAKGKRKIALTKEIADLEPQVKPANAAAAAQLVDQIKTKTVSTPEEAAEVRTLIEQLIEIVNYTAPGASEPLSPELKGTAVPVLVEFVGRFSESALAFDYLDTVAKPAVGVALRGIYAFGAHDAGRTSAVKFEGAITAAKARKELSDLQERVRTLTPAALDTAEKLTAVAADVEALTARVETGDHPITKADAEALLTGVLCTLAETDATVLKANQYETTTTLQSIVRGLERATEGEEMATVIDRIGQAHPEIFENGPVIKAFDDGLPDEALVIYNMGYTAHHLGVKTQKIQTAAERLERDTADPASLAVDRLREIQSTIPTASAEVDRLGERATEHRNDLARARRAPRITTAEDRIAERHEIDANSLATTLADLSERVNLVSERVSAAIQTREELDTKLQTIAAELPALQDKIENRVRNGQDYLAGRLDDEFDSVRDLVREREIAVASNQEATVTLHTLYRSIAEATNLPYKRIKDACETGTDTELANILGAEQFGRIIDLSAHLRRAVEDSRKAAGLLDQGIKRAKAVFGEDSAEDLAVVTLPGDALRTIDGDDLESLAFDTSSTMEAVVEARVEVEPEFTPVENPPAVRSPYSPVFISGDHAYVRDVADRTGQNPREFDTKALEGRRFDLLQRREDLQAQKGSLEQNAPDAARVLSQRRKRFDATVTKAEKRLQGQIDAAAKKSEQLDTSVKAAVSLANTQRQLATVERDIETEEEAAYKIIMGKPVKQRSGLPAALDARVPSDDAEIDGRIDQLIVLDDMRSDLEQAEAKLQRDLGKEKRGARELAAARDEAAEKHRALVAQQQNIRSEMAPELERTLSKPAKVGTIGSQTTIDNPLAIERNYQAQIKSIESELNLIETTLLQVDAAQSGIMAAERAEATAKVRQLEVLARQIPGVQIQHDVAATDGKYGEWQTEAREEVTARQAAVAEIDAEAARNQTDDAVQEKLGEVLTAQQAIRQEELAIIERHEREAVEVAQNTAKEVLAVEAHNFQMRDIYRDRAARIHQIRELEQTAHEKTRGFEFELYQARKDADNAPQILAERPDLQAEISRRHADAGAKDASIWSDPNAYARFHTEVVNEIRQEALAPQIGDARTGLYPTLTVDTLLNLIDIMQNPNAVSALPLEFTGRNASVLATLMVERTDADGRNTLAGTLLTGIVFDVATNPTARAAEIPGVSKVERLKLRDKVTFEDGTLVAVVYTSLQKDAIKSVEIKFTDATGETRTEDVTSFVPRSE